MQYAHYLEWSTHYLESWQVVVTALVSDEQTGEYLILTSLYRPSAMPSAISEIMHRVAQHRAAALTNMTGNIYVTFIYINLHLFLIFYLTLTLT